MNLRRAARRWGAVARTLVPLAVVALALAAVIVQETLPDALAASVAVVVLAPIAAFGGLPRGIPVSALAIAAVVAVGAMAVTGVGQGSAHVGLAVVAAVSFTALYAIAPADSSPVPIFIALVVGGLAGRFGWEWGAAALMGGLLINGFVSLGVLLLDDPTRRTTPMSSVLSMTALAAILTRPYMGI